MFKKLHKSVIDKNKLLSNLHSKRVNKTPSKVVYPNRTNLTFANIIVNMSSNQSLGNIDNLNNSYFDTKPNNNSFSIRTKKKINEIQNNNHLQDNNSRFLSTIINGIVSLKTNDLLNYSMKLIEIIIYMRDKYDYNNYIDITSEANKHLLMIIYQTFFQIFNKKSILYIILKKDLKNSMKIFRNLHTVYIFYILSGITFIYSNLNAENKNFFNFLKKLIKNEKCNNLKCPLCSQIENIEKNNLNLYSNNYMDNFRQKSSVIKIFWKKAEKGNIINNTTNNNFKLNNNFHKIFHIKEKAKYNVINISNDNIQRKKKLNISSQSHNGDKSFNIGLKKNKIEKEYFSNVMTERNYEKISHTKRCKNNNKKKLFYSQIVKANEKVKNLFFNDSLSSKEKSYSKNKIHKNESKPLDDSFSIHNYKEKKEYNINDKNKIIKKEDYSNLIDGIKIKLYKKKKLINNCDTNIDYKNNRLINKIENNINNKNKINSKENNKNSKNKKGIINYSTEVKHKSKNHITLGNLLRKNNIIDKKEYIKINNNINNSSKIIKENIIAIENDIKNFKEHNNYIKQQLLSLMQKNKAY